MESPDSPDSPDWLTLPEIVNEKIFDFFNPSELLSLRRVCTLWQRLAEASAETRDKLVLMQCGCQNNDNCDCSLSLMLKIVPAVFFFHHDLNADGTKYDNVDEDSHIAVHAKVNRIQCRSFDWKNAQLLARLFPRISNFTVSHNLISARHLDQIRYLLTEWSPTLTAFKFHSDYTLENTDGPVTNAINQTSAFIDAHLLILFAQLNSLPELKHLTLHYAKGKINSTIPDFAFLPRLEELQLDRTTLEANLQAACQQYLAPPVPGAPQPVLRRFAHHANQLDPTVREFTRFLQDSPEALPLATATTWNSQFAFQNPTNLPNILRFPSLGCLNISITPGSTLAPLSRALSPQNVTVLMFALVGTGAVEEDAVDDLVPVPSVRGLTIFLYSPDHGRIYPLLAQIPTVFPRLSSLVLMDRRSQCTNAPSGAPFSTTADEAPEFARFAADLLAAYPNATQPAKYQQVQSLLTIVRQINSIFPTINRDFNFCGPQNFSLRLTGQQL